MLCRVLLAAVLVAMLIAAPLFALARVEASLMVFASTLIM